MIKPTNHNRGYIGLIALLIVVAIMVFLMFKGYQNYGIIKTGSNLNTVTPIDQAKNVKKILETLNL